MAEPAKFSIILKIYPVHIKYFGNRGCSYLSLHIMIQIKLIGSTADHAIRNAALCEYAHQPKQLICEHTDMVLVHEWFLANYSTCGSTGTTFFGQCLASTFDHRTVQSKK
jgi:hypothetical protein